MDRIKITSHQLFSLIANCAIGGPIIVIASVVASIAKQDAWISVVFAEFFGILLIWIIWFLGSQYPNMTLIYIIKQILGKWIGTIVAASFVFLCLTIAYHLPWYIGDFVTTQAMPQTPAYAINLLFVIVVSISILYGIETIARASELFIYIVSILFFIAMILVSPNAKIENIQPIFENGIITILKGSVILSCVFTFHLIILMMIYPINIDNILEAKRSLLKGYLWAGLIIFITTLMSILVLGGPVAAVSQFPTYLLAKEIRVGSVLTRLEFIIAVIWIITLFMIGTLFFYAGVIGLSQLLKLKDHKLIVMPLGLIISVMSVVVFPDAIYQKNWINLIWTPYIITYGVILPVTLLIVFLIKKYIFKVDVKT
ncbi:endospore germination permease [Clostridium sp. JS66]|uniref:GerAB/ArcD/ProY family transporter n=1 Tax=Clostridium sp. JS66 TaxID=3064705 RepID=UPI00298DA40F|nr:endospore germination permease [Clostridium sp. JS66]WPC39468.1 endospore germination permease [Clostridium sp. JS66]